jgi:pimeloyl-ACP methyl ester carboxylesterase
MPTTKVGTQWFAVGADDKPTPGQTPLDIELAYETYGDAGAAPLLLCNGVTMQGVLFGTDFLEALAAAGPYYVIVYDARDCGLSSGELRHARSGSTAKARPCGLSQ